MMFIDKYSKIFLTEEEIRRIDFKENINDLINNKDDVFEGVINIASILENINTSINGRIEDVIEDLNKFWDYDIEEISSKFVTLEEILKENFGLKDDLCENNGHFTNEGSICYEKLVKMINDLGKIIDIDTEDMITQLDKIEYDV